MVYKLANKTSTSSMSGLIDLQCDLTVNKNLLPSTILSDPPLYGKIPFVDFWKHDGTEKFEITNFNKFAVIKTVASISFIDEGSRGNWGKVNIPYYEMNGVERTYYDEYTKYKDGIQSGWLTMGDGSHRYVDPITLVHSDVFEFFKGHDANEPCRDCCLNEPVLYIADGMHRIMSGLEGGVEGLEAHVIVRKSFTWLNYAK